VLVVGFFAAGCEDLVVREDIVLGVAADPGAVRSSLERRCFKKVKQGGKGGWLER
jgi:hypothetical protein